MLALNIKNGIFYTNKQLKDKTIEKNPIHHMHFLACNFYKIEDNPQWDKH